MHVHHVLSTPKLMHPSPGATSRLSIDLCAGEDPVDQPLCQQSALTGSDQITRVDVRRRQDSRSERNQGTCRCQVSWWTKRIRPTISCWFALIYRVSIYTNKKYLHLRQQASASLVVKARNPPAVGRGFEAYRAHDFLLKKTNHSATPHHHVGPYCHFIDATSSCGTATWACKLLVVALLWPKSIDDNLVRQKGAPDDPSY
jgi:hypothetical protein